MADRQNNLKTEAFQSEELKRYLFYEASETERGQLEARFFESEELFYELLDLENDLTDRYARNELGEKDKKRYAESLGKSSERRAKLANAVSLQTFIKEETVSAAKESPSFLGKLSSFFGLNAAGFQYATAALVFLLLVGGGFLVLERRRDAQELARLRQSEIERTAEIEREKALREQIKMIQEREQSLVGELAEKNGRAEILTEQLSREQTERARLTLELKNLKRRKTIETPEIQTPAPTIATVFLAPIGGRGVGDAGIISVGKNIEMIAATLQIPPESAAETFSVRLNSAPLAARLKANRTKSGGKYVRVSFPAKNLSPDAENLLIVVGSDDSRYNYVLRRQK